MERLDIDSSAVKSAHYDEQRHILEVEYSDSSIYRYHLVSPHQVTEILSAKSVGRYLNEKVIGKHPDEFMGYSDHANVGLSSE
jgi:hypothetical protein